MTGAEVAKIRTVLREELARVGLVPPNPHVEPGIYRVQADGTWWRVPERVEATADMAAEEGG